MYFDESPVLERLQEPTALVAVLVACTILIVVVGLYPGPIISYLLQVANSLVPAGASFSH